MPRFLHQAFTQWSDRSPGETGTPLGFSTRLFGALAKPVSWVYRAGAFIDRRLRAVPQLPLSDHTLLVVVSSPLVGGVGKTPLCASLATRIAETGRDTHIITYGYKRETGETPGDEALMLRQMTGLAVHAGDDPAEIVADLDAQNANRCLILDDGIRRRWRNEHRIVVFTARDLERPVRYLPDGRWRIPPQRTWPAQGVAIIHADDAEPADQDHHRRVLNQWGYTGPVGWYKTHVLGLAPLGDIEVRPLQDAPDNCPIAFCGLGLPSRFFAQLSSLGLIPKTTEIFPDHHPYCEADLKRLIAGAQRAKARWLLTTHKDAVKINPEWADDIPIYILRISLELHAGADMLSVILDVPR
jgi:tetraacyldisaccharide 4'-kinase